MRIHDVSLPIGPDLLIWPDNPPAEVIPRLRMAKGDGANVSELRIGTHTGTHVDPPVHFIDGAPGIDRVDLDILIGEATVADLRGVPGPVGPAELDALGVGQDVVRLLLRTDNSAIWHQRGGDGGPPPFPERYVALSPEGARWIVDRSIRLVGIDFLSIEQRGAPGHPTHRTLLEDGVVIIEGLDLSSIEPGVYRLVCMPLRIEDGDGGPARAALIEEAP